MLRVGAHARGAKNQFQSPLPARPRIGAARAPPPARPPASGGAGALEPPPLRLKLATRAGEARGQPLREHSSGLRGRPLDARAPLSQQSSESIVAPKGGGRERRDRAETRCGATGRAKNDSSAAAGDLKAREVLFSLILCAMGDVSDPDGPTPPPSPAAAAAMDDSSSSSIEVDDVKSDASDVDSKPLDLKRHHHHQPPPSTKEPVSAPKASEYLSLLGAQHEARLSAVDTATAAAAAAAAVLAWCPALMPPWCQLVPAWCRPPPLGVPPPPKNKNHHAKNTSNTGSVTHQNLFSTILHAVNQKINFFLLPKKLF